jgi:filamentous hemagglutinin family protein
MIHTVTLVRRQRTRQSLMMGCASVALAATALASQKAEAQAFVGTPTTASGTVTYARSTPGTETVVLRSRTATINWTPTNQQPGAGPIDFLPAGNTATFSSSSAITDYTVLNRITPASGQSIALNGHVISTLQEGSEIGGNVWFYAPGGIVVGSSAVFNVGSLLLTTNNVTNFSTSTNGFNASFSGPSGSNSSVSIQNGAQINALRQGSYVALIAPRIEQGGKIRVNGSAAYAAGEQLTMTMNQGLFDIQVNVGTTDGNGIVHTGETSGPANATAADNHKIYMVAVPKNQALTMLLGGAVGFDDAVNASVENGQILLSSGWGVRDSNGSGQYYNVNRGLNSNIDIGSGNYTSTVTAWGQGTLQANAETADIHFGGNLELNSWGGSGSSVTTLTAFNDHQLAVAGDLRLLSSEPATYASAQVASFSGGSVTVGGSASLNAWDGPNGGDVGLRASSGTISIGGPATLKASGNGGKPTGSGGSDSSGGSASVDASNGGSITTGDLTMDASAVGQSSFERGSAGSGQGGDVWITADNGSLTVNGNLIARANGTGGDAAGQAGNGNGGGIEVASDSGSVSVTGSMDLQANGMAGSGASPGAGTGGFIGLFAAGGSIDSPSLLLAANGTNTGGILELGSDGDFSGSKGSLQFGSVDATANGGDTGGLIFVTSGSGSTVDLGDASLRASGAFAGSISLLAGTCFECGGGEDFAAHTAALPAGGGIFATNLALDSTGNILISLSGGADVSVSNNLIGNAGQMISLIDDGTGGAIRAHEIDLNAITIDGNADIFADIIRFSTSSSMTLGKLTATDEISLFAGDELATGDLTSRKIDLEGTNLSFGDVRADEFDFSADGSVTGGNINVTTRANGDAEGAIALGNITAGPDLPSGNDFSVGMSSATSISVGNVTGSGHVGFATLGDLTTGNLGASDLVMLLVGGDIHTGSIATTPTGRVYLADASMFLTGGGGGDGNFDPNIVLALAPVPTGGSITIGGPVTSGRMQAAAGGNLTIGDVTAATDVTLSAGGLASFNGTLRSPTITVTSSDIDIALGASLGATGITNLLTLNALSNGLPIILGNGPAAPGQYHLGGEAGDIRATSVVLNAQGSAPDIQVFDANIDGSATSGGGVTNLTLNTGGSVFVRGLVNWTNAGASDTLTFNAGNLILVNTDTGGIQLTNSAGNLAGTLALNANNVWVVNGALLSQLQADVNFAGRDAALGANSGIANQQGFVRAGAITANVGNTFLVQNSGTPQLFAGIDTGAGGLSVNSTGATPAILIIYGRQTAANGAVITNEDFLGSVNVGGTGGFTPDSSVNGCEIGSAASCDAPTFFLDNSSLLGPLSEDSDDDKKKDQDQAEGDARVDPSMRLINTAPINLDHMINDPVTSGGDVIVGGPVQP